MIFSHICHPKFYYTLVWLVKISFSKHRPRLVWIFANIIFLCPFQDTVWDTSKESISAFLQNWLKSYLNSTVSHLRHSFVYEINSLTSVKLCCNHKAELQPCLNVTLHLNTLLYVYNWCNFIFVFMYVKHYLTID